MTAKEWDAHFDELEVQGIITRMENIELQVIVMFAMRAGVKTVTPAKFYRALLESPIFKARASKISTWDPF